MVGITSLTNKHITLSTCNQRTSPNNHFELCIPFHLQIPVKARRDSNQKVSEWAKGLVSGIRCQSRRHYFVVVLAVETETVYVLSQSAEMSSSPRCFMKFHLFGNEALIAPLETSNNKMMKRKRRSRCSFFMAASPKQHSEKGKTRHVTSTSHRPSQPRPVPPRCATYPSASGAWSSSAGGATGADSGSRPGSSGAQDPRAVWYQPRPGWNDARTCAP